MILKRATLPLPLRHLSFSCSDKISGLIVQKKSCTVKRKQICIYGKELRICVYRKRELLISHFVEFLKICHEMFINQPMFHVIWAFEGRVKSRLPFAGIIRSLP